MGTIARVGQGAVVVVRRVARARVGRAKQAVDRVVVARRGETAVSRPTADGAYKLGFAPPRVGRAVVVAVASPARLSSSDRTARLARRFARVRGDARALVLARRVFVSAA